MSSFYNRIKGAISEGAEFLRLKKRPEVDEICGNPDPVHPNLLSHLFGEKVTEKHRAKFEKKLRKNCPEIVNAFFDKQYKSDFYEKFYSAVPKYLDYPNKSVEMLGNLCAYASEFSMSWSQYLIGTMGGRKLLMDVFKSPKKITAITNLFLILSTVYVMSGYDELFFKKEYFALLPNIEEIFYGTILENTMVRFAANKISSVALLAILEKFIKEKDKIDL
jgi:hypothetical protein